MNDEQVKTLITLVWFLFHIFVAATTMWLAERKGRKVWQCWIWGIFALFFSLVPLVVLLLLPGVQKENDKVEQ